jgi:hypothetical protein
LNLAPEELMPVPDKTRLTAEPTTATPDAERTAS